MEIPLKFQISDNRNSNFYKNKTFCGYKKTNVFHALEKSLLEGKLEDSCNWSIEIVISGYIDELWDKIMVFICKHINIANIEIIYYFKIRYESYLKFMKYSGITNYLQLRNNQQFRNLVCEIVCILCKSRKMKLDNLKKVKKNNLRLESLREKMKANIIINKDIVKVDDPEEIKIVSNEFLFCIRNFEFKNSLFWLSWMIEWEKLNIKKLKVFNCAYRPQKNVDNKFAYDFIWLIWSIIILEANRKKTAFLKEISSLFYLFKHNYKKSKKNKRIILVVYAIKLLFYGGFKEPNIIEKYDILIQACCNINFLYREKKSYENASKDIMKKLKFYNIQRDSLRSQVNPHKKKVVKKKKPKNISERSLQKLNIVMDMGTIIRTDNANRTKIVHYARSDPGDRIKQINIIGRKNKFS